MQTIKSEIKIDKEGFNDCPSRKELITDLAYVYSKIEYVDVIDDGGYWKNTQDTLVIRTDADTLLGILEWLTADEFQKIKDGEKYIARFWWD